MPHRQKTEACFVKSLCWFALLYVVGPPAHPVVGASPKPVNAEPGFCKPYTWLSGDWVTAPRIPLLGDINGDGYADFIYASPRDRVIDVSLNGRGWKPLRGERLLSNLPQNIVAITLGHFGGKGLDLAILGNKGLVMTSLNDGAGHFAAPVTVTTVEDAGAASWLLTVPTGSSRALDNLAVVTRNGQVRLYDCRSGALTAEFSAQGPIKAAAAFTPGGHPCTLAFLSGESAILYQVAGKPTRTALIRAPAGQTALAVGDVNTDGEADVLVNGRVFLGPGFRQSIPVPGWEKFTTPVIGMMANVVGRGRSDIVIQHEGKDGFGSFETDCDLLISYLKSDQDWDADGLSNADEARIGSDPLDRSTSHDGILDGWKVHGFWGVDFPGMGASPLHKDIFVMNLPYEKVPVDKMEKFMHDRVVPFFGSLPYTNVDGSRGFAIHSMTQSPAYSPKEGEGNEWGRVHDDTFPRDRTGLYHWMLVSGMGGGGQSGQLADAGSCGMGSWIHEFGHQLGLSHSGKWAAWSPTYTSLMNYSYSYQFDGDPAKVHFSTGDLSGSILNESHLPGKLPFPMEKLKFLTGPPYHFHLQPAGPDATYVDWGWSGVFSDRTVRANITFGYGVSAGERLQPGGKQKFNYNGPYEMMTDFQASLAEHQKKLYMVTATRPPLDPKAPRPDSETLVLQTYRGHSAWSDPVTIAPRVTGDPYAASDGQDFYVFYPTADGVMYRGGQPEALGDPHLIPDSKGAQVSAINWNGTLYLFLWTGPDRSITIQTVQGQRIGPAVDMGIRSSIPPGPAIDTIRGQLLLGTAGALGEQAYRWQLHRLDWDKESGRFKEASWSFVGGEKSGWAGNRRPTLIFNPDHEFGPQGRVYWIGAGVAQPITSSTAFFIAQTIGYKDVNDGWLLWRYYDEWTNTRSGIGAAWFDKDIVLATTWASGTAGGDGGVFCAYHGTTIGDVDMGDFDDITLMANYGISRSIETFAQMPPIGVDR